MDIGFDAKRAFLNTSGLGNYSRTLIRAISHYYPQHNYSLFTTKTEGCPFSKIAASIPNVTICEPGSFLDKKLKARWRSYGITEMLKEKQVSIYHGLSNELPFNIGKFNGRKIVTIHDVIFLRYPQLYPFLDRKIYNRKFRSCCDQADTIIAISAQTKKDIERFYFVPEEKVKVVYQSCDPSFYKGFTEESDRATRKKYGLPGEYILYVGTMEERKNLLAVVKALHEIKNVPLVAVGKKRKYFEEVMKYAVQHKLDKRIVFVHNAAHNEMAAVYRGAQLFIFPSIFEGFGIPIIEALVCRVPVIASKGSCFPETAGPHSVFFNPLDPKELAEKINQVLNAPSQMHEMSEKGFEYARRFHPSVITTQLMKIYESQ